MIAQADKDQVSGNEVTGETTDFTLCTGHRLDSCDLCITASWSLDAEMTVRNGETS